MTDGERLVWATSYALSLARCGDARVATRAATTAVVQLRETATSRGAATGRSAEELDEHLFLDEIVNVP